MTWIAIDRAKPTVDYASALPASLVDSAAARRCVDQLFTVQEAEALTLKLFGTEHFSWVTADAVELPLSREVVERMSRTEGTGDHRFVGRVRMVGKK